MSSQDLNEVRAEALSLEVCSTYAVYENCTHRFGFDSEQSADRVTELVLMWDYSISWAV